MLNNGNSDYKQKLVIHEVETYEHDYTFMQIPVIE